MYTIQQLLELKEKEAADLRDRIRELQCECLSSGIGLRLNAEAHAAELETQKMYLVRAKDQIERFRARIARMAVD